MTAQNSICITVVGKYTKDPIGYISKVTSSRQNYDGWNEFLKRINNFNEIDEIFVSWYYEYFNSQ